VSDFVREVEAEYGWPLVDGRNEDITFMAHLWEPLRYPPTHPPDFTHKSTVCLAYHAL